MSTQSDHPDQSPFEECNCLDCDAVRYKWEFGDGQYCDTECRTRHEGQEVLKDFRRDHTLCFTCMRRIKTIEPSKPDFEFTERGHGWTRRPDDDGFKLEFYDQSVTRSAACGWQYRTKHAGDGEKQRFGVVVTGVICQSCGNTAHSHHEACLADHHAIQRLITLLRQLDDYRVDPIRLHREYEATGRDIDLAVGRAVTETDE